MIEVCVMGEVRTIAMGKNGDSFYEKYFDANLFNYLPSQNFLLL